MSFTIEDLKGLGMAFMCALYFWAGYKSGHHEAAKQAATPEPKGGAASGGTK